MRKRQPKNICKTYFNGIEQPKNKKRLNENNGTSHKNRNDFQEAAIETKRKLFAEVCISYLNT